MSEVRRGVCGLQCKKSWAKPWPVGGSMQSNLWQWAPVPLCSRASYGIAATSSWCTISSEIHDFMQEITLFQWHSQKWGRLPLVHQYTLFNSGLELQLLIQVTLVTGHIKV
jgi:hypothetical protein